MHTFLALDTKLIPQSTKDDVPSYSKGRFSNDGSRMLIDGYNHDGNLVHPDKTIKVWLIGLSDEEAESAKNELISTAIKYTKTEIRAEMINPSSIWFEGW